jgi:8-oxo-dGTP diphosphatase
MEQATSHSVFHAAIATTTALFSFDEDGLRVLLVRRETPNTPTQSGWALPGLILSPEQEPETAAFSLAVSVSGQNWLELHQVRAFTAPDRHPAGRVINIAWYGFLSPVPDLPAPPTWAKEMRWVPETELPPLLFDHEEVLASARKRLKKRMRRHPVAFRMLPVLFSLNDLQAVYEQVFEMELDKRNFRKKVMASGLVLETGISRSRDRGQGRSAKLFRFDWENYRKDRERLFHFDL